MYKFALVCVVFLGCGKSDDKVSPETHAPKAGGEEPNIETLGSPKIDAAAAAAKAKAGEPNVPSLSAEERAAYKKYLRAGRKLAKSEKWSEASAEFERALKVIPEDGRALSELGWTAFKAGSFERALVANRLSVRRTRDPKLKAASLYNLGRVFEAKDNAQEAAQSYRESIALRPNKSVTSRLETLQMKPTEPAAFCAAPMATEKVCECLSKAEGFEEEMEWGCTMKETSGGAAVVELAGNAETQTYYLAKRAKGWELFGEGMPTMSGMNGVNESFRANIEVRTVGERKVLWVHTFFERTDYDMGINEAEESSAEEIEVCIVPLVEDEKIVCPHVFPYASSYSRGLVEEELGYDPEGELDGKPEAGARQWTVTMTDKGVVQVALVRGHLEDGEQQRIGSHPLF